MTIARINPLDPIQPGKQAGRGGQVEKGDNSDSISLSSEAVEKAEMYKTLELVSVAPDVRAERIMELKKKINDPSYINEVVIKATADKIMNAFGL